VLLARLCFEKCKAKGPEKLHGHGPMQAGPPYKREMKSLLAQPPRRGDDCGLPRRGAWRKIERKIEHQMARSSGPDDVLEIVLGGSGPGKVEKLRLIGAIDWYGTTP